MISNQTINSFIIVDSISRSELNDDLDVWISRDRAFSVIKLKYIASICKKLIFCVQLGIIGESQNFSTCIV